MHHPAVCGNRLLQPGLIGQSLPAPAWFCPALPDRTRTGFARCSLPCRTKQPADFAIAQFGLLLLLQKGCSFIACPAGSGNNRRRSPQPGGAAVPGVESGPTHSLWEGFSVCRRAGRGPLRVQSSPGLSFSRFLRRGDCKTFPAKNETGFPARGVCLIFAVAEKCRVLHHGIPKGEAAFFVMAFGAIFQTSADICKSKQIKHRLIRARVPLLRDVSDSFI